LLRSSFVRRSSDDDNCRAPIGLVTIGQERDLRLRLARDVRGCRPGDRDLRLSTDDLIGRADHWKRRPRAVKLADNRMRRSP
jgi:hypothetical protein